jgi:hypothetical protein
MGMQGSAGQGMQGKSRGGVIAICEWTRDIGDARARGMGWDIQTPEILAEYSVLRQRIRGEFAAVTEWCIEEARRLTGSVRLPRAMLGEASPELLDRFGTSSLQHLPKRRWCIIHLWRRR